MGPKNNKYSMSSLRTRELKKAIQSAPREISTVRGRLFTEVFIQNDEKPLILKRALAFHTFMEKIPINIYDNELFWLGNRGKT
jgi:pyruvate-formate lyase